MKNKVLAMVFQKTSTRTRCSFEAGIAKMGGYAMFLNWKDTQLVLADLGDETRAISRFSDIIMARMLKHKDIVKMAESSEVPIINGLTEKYHPCQGLADVMTIKEICRGKRGKVVYIGIANNVSNSLSLACVKLGINFVLCTPERDKDSFDKELLSIVKKSGLYKEESNIKKALKNADVVYTDTWINMEFYLNPKFKKEKQRRIKKFKPYQINKKMLKYAKSNVKVMHDMPMHYGFEITEEVAQSKNSVIFQQAENRMHAQNALMLYLLKKN